MPAFNTTTNNNNNNMSGAAIAAGAQVAGSALGMIGQNKRAKKQHNRQKELMGIQLKNQQELNKQGQALQMKTWQDTGYGAQMEMMKEAGLNPALMYGMSGGGGQTTGSQGGGSAQSGNSHAPMDIGAAIQAGLANAQRELINSQKRKTDADTEQIRKNTEKTVVDTSKVKKEIDNIIAQTGSEKEKKALLVIQQNLESEKIKKLAKDTELVGKQITGVNRDNALKQYEIELNEIGIQKTDNKLFRYISKLASDNGFDLVGLLKTLFSKDKEDIVPLGKD